MILPSLPGPHSWCSLSTSACAACSPQTWPVHSSGWQVPPDPGMVRPQVPLPSFPQPQDWPCGPLHRSQKRLTTCCEKNRRKILKPPRRVQLEILKTILQEKCFEKEKENWSQRCPKKAWPNFSVKKQGSALSQEQVQGKMVALITNGKWMNKSFFEKKKKKKWRKKKQKNVKLYKGPGPMKWCLLEMREWRSKKRKVTNGFTRSTTNLSSFNSQSLNKWSLKSVRETREPGSARSRPSRPSRPAHRVSGLK